MLAALDDEQLATMLALGWLGRSHHETEQWPQLIENARQSVGEGFVRHRAYMMSVMRDVAAGLSKIEASFGSLA